MLNRLFIVVGIIAILALAAAFVVPSFIPWGAYRDRMAAIAGEVLGAPVTIKGEIKFSLLPQPRLEFSKVSAGPAGAPNLTVERVAAEFSLIDFIRDRYTVTDLQLEQPVIDVKVGSDGSVDTGIALAQQVSTSNVSIADARITSGTIRLNDARSGDVYVAEDVNGMVKLEALRGPFSFQGTGHIDGAGYGLRLTSGAFDEDGTAQLSASLRPVDEHFSFAAEGVLTTGLKPGFSGTMTYRQPPPKAVDPADADAGQGDMVMTSKVEATPARVLLSDYVVIPDENRAATRLQGAADVTLGANMAFNAVISGGLIALPPRDATAEQAVEPYELIRLLKELPLPAAPALPGTIGVDVAELNLRAFSLRNVRLDATAHDGAWSVRQFSGRLPGDTTVTLAGEVTTATGHPEFAGTFALKSQRLDALSTLWRKPAPGNPLFAMPGEIEAQVNLVGETLSLSNGRLILDGESRSFSAQVGIGASRDIHLDADLGELDAARSDALMALLPDLAADQAFPVTFPKGEFSIIADALTLGGMNGKALSAKGSWDGGVLAIDDASAGDLGGAALQVTATVFGTLARPELSGSGTVTVQSPDAPALQVFLGALNAPPVISAFLKKSFPVDIALRLAAPSGDGAQSLTLAGNAGTSTIEADAELQAGFLRALSGPLKLRIDARSADPAAMTAQLGLGDTSLIAGEGPMHLVGMIEGHVANSLATTIRVEGGGDSLGFSGNVVVTNPDAFSGSGTLKATLSDLQSVGDRLGIGGVTLPPLSGSAQLDFDGLKSIRLSNLAGSSGGRSFTGQLAFTTVAGTRTISGEIAAGQLDAAGLLETLAGPAALLQGPDALWPDGPLAIGDTPRTTVGRVKVTAPTMTIGARNSLQNINFDLDWDATATRLRGFSGEIGGGTVGLELSLCCAGPLSDKTSTGRISLAGIDLDAIVPDTVAKALNGKLNSAGQFNGTGGSVLSILSALTGDGTYSVDQLQIEHLDPNAIAAVTRLETVLDMKPEQLTAVIEEKLNDAGFSSRQMSGGFTVAGGVLRSPNVPIVGEGGQLFGSGSIRLADLLLGGSYVLSATAVSPASLVDTSFAKVTATLAGTLLAPERSIDASGLVDAIMVRAYEVEVARLEKLRAEDEARKTAEAEEKARLAAEEEARKAAEAKRLADEAAAKLAADEAAAKQATEAAAAKRAAEDAAAKAKADKAAAEAAALKKAQEDLNKPMDLGLGN